MMSRTFAWAMACMTLFSTATLYAQTNILEPNSNLQSRPLFQSLQESLDLLSRAEIEREEAALLGKTESALKGIRDSCRTTIGRLRSLEISLQQLLRENYQIKPSERDHNGWGVSELESLQRNLKVQMARAYRNQALCYGGDSIDRFNSLSQAFEQLARVLSQPLDETSVWQARIEHVMCLRLDNKTDQAFEQIDRWLQASPPADIASRLNGEMLHALIAIGRVDRALQLASQLAQADTVVPETDDAILETLLTGRRIQQAIQQLHHITASHSPYWKRRAELRIGLAVAVQPDTKDADLLNLAAVGLYAADRKDEAVSIYDRIAQLADSQVNRELRFQASKSAAAIVRESGQPLAALKRFRDLALKYQQHEHSPALHLTAIGLATERLRTADPRDRGKRFEQYVALLGEHLERWPDSPTAARVQQWQSRSQRPDIERQRARTLASLGNREQSIELYRPQLRKDPTDGDLHEAFAELLQQGSEKTELREALNVWRQVEQRSKPGSPRWWRGRRARLALLKQLGEGEQAAKLEQLTEILYPSRE